jgi:tetratricopeptide (TPR) repeat protein
LNSYESAKISQRPITDTKAYEYYLKAKKEAASWTVPGMEHALAYLHKGLEIEGDNVLFYYGIGYVYFMYINLEFKDKDECIIKAEQNVKRIFDIDPDSVYGHRLLEIINIRRSSLQQGVIQFKKTLSVNPADIDALTWLMCAYCNIGKQSAAIPIAEKIISIDPFNHVGLVTYAWIDFLNGNFSDSQKLGYRFYKMSSETPNTNLFFSLILAYNNRLEECFSVCDENLKNNPGNIFALIGQCLKYALQWGQSKNYQSHIRWS